MRKSLVALVVMEMICSGGVNKPITIDFSYKKPPPKPKINKRNIYKGS